MSASQGRNQQGRARMMVFVSHAHEDNVFCREIVKGLRGVGVDVWYDEYNMEPGELMAVIQRELDRRPVVVVILSKAAFSSTWVHREMTWAFELMDRDPSRLLVPITGGPIERNDFDPARGWLFLHPFRRIEAPGMRPYPESEAVRRLLHWLALRPDIEVSAPPANDDLPSAENADGLVARGKALAAQKEFAEAVSFFKRATELAPRLFAAWANLGRAYYEIGRYEPASDTDDRALAIDAKQAWVWNNKGLALRALHRTREALVAYDHALALGETAKRWTNKGNALHDLKCIEEALTAYDHALEHDPSFAPAWSNKGLALYDLRSYKEALVACEQALTLDPSSADAWSNRGIVLCGLRSYKEALAACEQALTLDPSFAPAWSNKGLALYGLRHFEEALVAYKRALALGETARRWQNAAKVLCALGRTAEAEAATQRARELSG